MELEKELKKDMKNGKRTLQSNQIEPGLICVASPLHEPGCVSEKKSVFLLVELKQFSLYF